MKKMSVVFLALFALVVTAVAGPYDAWSKYRTVTINTTGDAGGAGVATAQTNFPVLVRLTSDSPATGADVLAEALAGGADIRFSDETGAVALPFEIDHWSATSAAIWVRVPVVEGNAETDIRLYWGSAFSASESNSISVFNTSNRYRAVWHLNETASPSRDATSFGTDAVWMNSPAGGAGNIGGSVNIANPTGTSSANGKYLRAAYNTANDNFKMNAIDGLTVSAWVNRTSNNGEANQGIAGRWNWNGGNRRQYILEANATSWQFAVSQTGTNAEETVGSTPVVNGEWTHLAATYRDGEQTLYVNGVATDTRALDPYSSIDSAWAAAPFLIGRMETNNCCLQGIDARIDEVRLSDTTRSSDWVRLEYETQKSGATAVKLGASQEQVTTFAYANVAATYVVDSEIFPNTPVVNGTVTNITVSPALPAGLTINPLTGVISGTPTLAVGEGVYTVTALFSEPATELTTQLTITINPLAPTALSYPVTSVVYGMNAAITPNIPTVNSLSDPNRKVTNFSVSPALPTGLTIDSETGVISGTPTAPSNATNYTVTASNATGSTSQVISIAVLAPPSGLTYLQNPVTYDVGLPITGNKATVTGQVQTWTVSEGVLPAGLALDANTGLISGTPTSAGTGSFTVRASNISGFSEAVISYTVHAAEDYLTWPLSKTFDLNTSTANITQAQANFPALVRLTSVHADIFANAQGDGADIRFSLLDGTRLPYEIERWDDVAQKAEVWVLLPTVAVNGITKVRMHYGNVSATSKSNGYAVFNNTNNYVAVWHLGNAPGIDARPSSVAGAPTAKPSNHVGQFGGGAGTYVIPEGAIGRADTLRGGGNRQTPTATSDYLNIGSAADNATSPYSGNNAYAGYSDFSNGYTYSVWAKMGPHVNYTYLTALANQTNGNDNIHIFRPDGTGQRLRFEQMNATAGGGLITTANAVLSQTNWTYVTVTVQPGANANTNAVSIYVNGALVGGGNATQRPRVINRTNTWIGKSNWTGDSYISASFDEPRYSNVARSADWVKLEYLNQKPGATPIEDLEYTQASYSFIEESPITPITVAGLKGTAESYSISPALPPSLNFNTATGAITGTPDNGLATKTFTVTAHNGSWSTSTTFDLTITSLPPAGVAYSTNPVVYQAGLAAAPTVPTYTGTISSWSISPALPSGLHLNPQTGVISGEPLVASSETVYEVTGTGPEGSSTANVTITVLAPSENFSTWAQSRNIVLNTSASGANVAGTVTNFPLLVRLGQAESAIFSQAMAGGADVRFSKANGVTRLPYEIVSWDATAKTAEIWVKVDSVYGNNAAQSIKMFWGKSGSVDSSDGRRVFSASNGYVTAFHMGNPVGDSANGIRPNSVNPGTNDATPAFIGSHPTAVRQGIIGLADTLRGQGGAANGDHFNFGSLEATNYPNGLTLSMWAKPTSYTGDFVQFYTIGNINNGAGVNGHTVWMGKRGGGNDMSGEVAGSSRIDGPSGTAALNEWQYYSFSVLPGGAGSRLYRNGVQIAQATTTQNLSNIARTSNFIGRANWGDNTFNGVVDEVRFSNVSRSADFVRLEYQSQNKYQALANIGYQAPVVAYAVDSINATAGIAITAQVPVITGPASSLSIAPALPAGLNFNTATGEISGTIAAVYAPTTHTITASNNGATSSTTIVIRAVAPPAPGAPTAVAATAGISQASVSFTAPAFTGGVPVTGYTVTSHPGNTTATGAASPIVVTGLAAGTAYRFTVTASNLGGEGASSDTSSAVTPFNVPGAPLAVTGVAGNEQVVLNWSAPASDSGSAITSYTATSTPDGLTCTTPDGATTECIISGLTNGTGYTFTVTATNAVGAGAASAPSATLTPTPDPTPPSAPVTVTGVAGNGQVVVSWNVPLSNGGSAITGYTVTATPGGATCAWSEGPLSCTVTGLTNGTPYTFTVVATNDVGNSPASTASAAVTPRTVPGAPTAVVATAGATQASVAFTAPVNNGGAAVTEYTVTSHPGNLTATGATSPIVVTGLTAGTAYRFTVKAGNAAGAGAASDTSTAVTPYTTPGAPTAVTASAGNGRATVAFTPPASNGFSNITSYVVTAHPGNITATEGTSPIVVMGLSNGTAYRFTVRAVNAAGPGAASDTTTAVTPNAPPVIAYTPSTVSFPALAAITPPTLSSTGGPVTSWSITPALPAGLSFSTTTGQFSGTPTAVSAAANYTVVAHGALGNDTAVVSIAVVANPPVIAYTPTTLSFTRNVAITAPTLSSTGGPVTTWAVNPALPAGLAFNTTNGQISGTPTAASAAANYTVTATNSTGSATATLNITVLPGLPVIAYAGTPKSFIKGVADSLLVNSTGGEVASYSVAPALPAGLTLNTTTGRISGTPTAASAAANYTVTATNASGTATATVNIQVQDLTPVVAYPAAVDSFTVNIAATKTPTSTGGAVTSWTVTPALPAGLTLNATTGVLSGTPTAASAAANYTVIATNAYGADTVVLTLKVLPSTAIMGGAYTFRVSGMEKPYAFLLPAGASATEQVTMSITDVKGRIVWTRTVRPNANGAATEVVWTGRTRTGALASAGMYVVRVSVLNDGKVTEYVQKSVTLKSR